MGGPMPPTSKEAYSLALQDQIAGREVHPLQLTSQQQRLGGVGNSQFARNGATMLADGRLSVPEMPQQPGQWSEQQGKPSEVAGYSTTDGDALERLLLESAVSRK